MMVAMMDMSSVQTWDSNPCNAVETPGFELTKTGAAIVDLWAMSKFQWFCMAH